MIAMGGYLPQLAAATKRSTGTPRDLLLRQPRSTPAPRPRSLAGAQRYLVGASGLGASCAFFGSPFGCDLPNGNGKSFAF